MIGETIKEFKITARLGKGGMGEVWVAEQQIVKTRVAIKLLLAEVSTDTQQVQRFFNEAIAVAKIQHAGIVKIFDVGFTSRGQAYLIMELLEGETLASRLRRAGRFPTGQLAEVGRQMASVLAATHGAGITHRDLKPDNIFLVPDAELESGERVKILDFGIAKLASDTTGLTATGNSMGTPGYMAPEQWNDASKVDAQTDVYSLGCVLFEMCCGRLPFIASSIGEACTKHLTATPPAARSLEPGLPADIDAMIARMLAKSPRERPAMKEIGRMLAVTSARHPGQADTTLQEGPSSSLREAVTEPPKSKTTLGAAVSVLEPQPVRASRRGILVTGALVAAGAVALVYITTREGPTEAPPTPTPRASPAIAEAAVAREVAVPLVRAAFTEINHVPVQSEQVTRAAYAAYLAALPSEARSASVPLRDWSTARPDAPVAWVTFEQAQRYCSSLGGTLLSRERWLAASGGGWSIAGGPLREWTSSTTPDRLAFVMGASAAMTPAERAGAIAMPLEKDTEQSAASDRRPERIASATIGIRCTR